MNLDGVPASGSPVPVASRPRAISAWDEGLGAGPIFGYAGVDEDPDMPFRDHFHSPLVDRRSWDGLYGGWPAMIVANLSRKLPERDAAPRVHLGSSVEIDVAAFDEDELEAMASGRGDNGGGGVATAVGAPPRPTLVVATDLPDLDEYQVPVDYERRARRLVAAVEIVSPASKERPEHRRAFVAQCPAMLLNRVCVAIIDLVTPRPFNLDSDLMEFFGQTDPSLGEEPPSLDAVAGGWVKREEGRLLETWAHPLAIGQPLPTRPLRLAEDLAVPLELEPSSEETGRILRIPYTSSDRESKRRLL